MQHDVHVMYQNHFVHAKYIYFIHIFIDSILIVIFFCFKEGEEFDHEEDDDEEDDLDSGDE